LPSPSSWLSQHVGVVVVGLMTVFTIVFGARRLDPTERHEGLVLALATECVVKLVAFLSVGVFVTFVLFDGPGDLLAQLQRTPARDFMNWPNPPLDAAFLFGSFLILAMSAIQFLPRQFHVAVVENCDEDHVRTARWVLPLYLLLINLFVIPLAAAALLRASPGSGIDTYVLQLSQLAHNHWLALLVFLGGFSAATGMIVVEAMTVSTMVTNHLLLPIIERGRLALLRRSLLRVRWGVIAGILISGYLFDAALGRSFTLVNIGIIAFAAVVQFAPALLGGLFWRRGTGRGALLGIGIGGLLWLYTLLIPSLLSDTPVATSLLAHGPFGIALLRPEAFLGLSGLPRVPHAVLWSLLFNVGFYVVGSLLWEQPENERQTAEQFVAVGPLVRTLPADTTEEAKTVDLAEKQPMVRAVLRGYFTDSEAEELERRCAATLKLQPGQRVSVATLVAFYGELERVLAGSIGAPAAHHAIARGLVYSDEELARLPRVYARILAGLKVSPEELKRRVDYYQERAAILETQAAQLEARVAERTRELSASNEQLTAEILERKRAEAELERSNSELEQFAYVASHDLQEPLRMIASYLQLIERRYQDQLDKEGVEFIGYAVDGAKRMQSLINDLLLFARIGTRAITLAAIDSHTLLTRVLQDLRLATEESGATVVVGELPTVVADEVQLSQLFRNLLGNAFKFRSEAVPRIEVTAQRAAADGGEGWQFMVRDNGIGIEPRYFDQIFRLFHRLHTRAAYPGNGIGLSLCKKIVERHGGHIWVESEPGRGTAFWFTIPDRTRPPAGGDGGEGNAS
jgi:signal transduction histidine kinase/Na+/proline symporter